MEILVVGAGSLGSLIGGLLAREHAVTLVGREPHISHIRDSGLRLTGLFDERVSQAADTEIDRETADLAIVTVKAFDTETVVGDLLDIDLDAILSLQNGMGNEELLASRLSTPVLAGTTTYGAILRRPGVVECTGQGTVTLGPFEVASSKRSLARRIGSAFEAAGIETTVSNDMRSELWRKLAVNAGINPVTAIARVANGALRKGPLCAVATRAATETAAVARSEGIDLTDPAAKDALKTVAEATAENVSSMRQDMEAGRRTEIDAISGVVVDRADFEVPANVLLTTLVQTWERDQGLR